MNSQHSCEFFLSSYVNIQSQH